VTWVHLYGRSSVDRAVMQRTVCRQRGEGEIVFK
jgi:hypothetical protein